MWPFDCPCREIYLAADFLRLARRLEIAVTLGNDAHRPADTGRDFDQAVDLLRWCGCTHHSRFTARRRTLVPLPAAWTWRRSATDRTGCR